MNFEGQSEECTVLLSALPFYLVSIIPLLSHTHLRPTLCRYNPSNWHSLLVNVSSSKSRSICRNGLVIWYFIRKCRVTCIRQFSLYGAERGLPKCSAITGPLAFASIYIAPKLKIQYDTNWGEYINVFFMYIVASFCLLFLHAAIVCRMYSTFSTVDSTTLGSHWMVRCCCHCFTY